MENIPEGLNYSENAPFHLSLFQGWMNLLTMAQKSVDIVSSHWDLNHSHPSACQVSRIRRAWAMILLRCTLHSLVPWPPLLKCMLMFLVYCPPKSMDVTAHVCMCCCSSHVALLLLECLAFKGKIMFHVSISETLYTELLY